MTLAKSLNRKYSRISAHNNFSKQLLFLTQIQIGKVFGFDKRVQLGVSPQRLLSPSNFRRIAAQNTGRVGRHAMSCAPGQPIEMSSNEEGLVAADSIID